MKRILISCLPVVVLLWASTSQAQILGPQPRGQQGPKSDTPTGPAEAAPEEEKPEMPPMPPWPGQETKKVNFFNLKGYFRFRADMFNNLNLGMGDSAGGTYKAPFYVPLSEHANSKNSCAARVGKAPPGGEAVIEIEPIKNTCINATGSSGGGHSDTKIAGAAWGWGGHLRLFRRSLRPQHPV